MRVRIRETGQVLTGITPEHADHLTITGVATIIPEVEEVSMTPVPVADEASLTVTAEVEESAEPVGDVPRKRGRPRKS